MTSLPHSIRPLERAIHSVVDHMKNESALYIYADVELILMDVPSGHQTWLAGKLTYFQSFLDDVPTKASIHMGFSNTPSLNTRG